MIFDETTSALDYESENIIMSNIEPIARRRRIIEAGSHDELMKRNGFYAGLHQAQAG